MSGTGRQPPMGPTGSSSASQILGPTGPNNVDRIIAAAAPLVEGVTDAVKKATQADQDRSWIARTIIWIFVGVIAGMGVLLVIRGICTGDWNAVTTLAFELIKTAVLPIVTLVLGYYFGQAGKG